MYIHTTGRQEDQMKGKVMPIEVPYVEVHYAMCGHNDEICLYQTSHDVSAIAPEDLSDLIAWCEGSCFDPTNDQELPRILAQFDGDFVIKRVDTYDGNEISKQQLARFDEPVMVFFW